MKRKVVVLLFFIGILIGAFSSISFAAYNSVWIPGKAPSITGVGQTETDSIMVQGYKNYYFENVVWKSSDENILSIIETTDTMVKTMGINPGVATISVDFDFYYEVSTTASPSDAAVDESDVQMKHYQLSFRRNVYGVEGDFVYALYDDFVMIDKYTGNSSYVVIPDSFHGQPVTIIDMWAFSNKTVEEVVIPDAVTDLYLYTFLDCKNLKVVNLPADMEEISEHAFDGCISLAKIKNESSINVDLNCFQDTLNNGTNDSWYTKEIGGELIEGELSGNMTMYRQFPVKYHIEGLSQQNIDTLIGQSLNPLRFSPLNETILNDLPDYKGVKFSHWEMRTNPSMPITTSKIEKGTYGAIDLYAVYSGEADKNSSRSSSGSGSDTTAAGPKNYSAFTNTVEIMTNSDFINHGAWKLNDRVWNYIDSNNGVITNSWVYDQDKWYLLDGTGSMVNGWQKVNGSWYLFALDGSMLTGWQYVNYKWYYLNTDGSMMTGWIIDKGNYYYLNQAGALLTNATTPDGYRVNNDGVWLP